VTDQHEVAPESPFALMSDAEARAWYAYMKVHLRLRWEMNRQLRTDSGLSLADYDILVALISDEAGVLSVSNLATRLGWERSRASHHARRMAERGLVDLRPGAADRRSTDVALTVAGRATLAAASPGHVDLIRRAVLDALDGERLDGFAESLERVYETLIEHGTLPRPADHP
jgi:DNA-binding MarR family transcriptional regulator